VSRVNAIGGDLAGKWLSKFLTDHLAGERDLSDLSPQTIASYRDAIKLLLTWFRDVEGTRPEKLRLADLDRARVLSFLNWLEAERGNSPATRNQRLAVIKSFVRYTAVERPEFLEHATQILAVKQKKTRPLTWATLPAARSKLCWPNQIQPTSAGCATRSCSPCSTTQPPASRRSAT
jgi:integrase/recombinase XerD